MKIKQELENLENEINNNWLNLHKIKDLVKLKELHYKQVKKDELQILEDKLYELDEKYYLRWKDAEILKEITEVQNKINLLLKK